VTAHELRHALVNLDLSQTALAKAIGAHPGSVSAWATGVKAVPDYVAAWIAQEVRIRQLQRTISLLEAALSERRAAELKAGEPRSLKRECSRRVRITSE
jgi:transcriptional regulator with XRE-family HTH domain